MVSFQLSDEQRLIQKTIADFVKSEVRDKARDWDEAMQLDGGALDRVWQLGLLQHVLPAEAGGGGEAREVTTGTIIAEELAAGDLAFACALFSAYAVALPILLFGSQAQQDRLKKFTANAFLPCASALLEPVFFFDLESIRTTARRENGDVVLSGKKCLVPFAAEAEEILVYATSAPGAGSGSVRGVFVPAKATGLKKTKEAYMGLRALPLYEIELNDVKVPAENCLGKERGDYFDYVASAARIALAAMAVGVARSSYEYAREYAKERVAFGEPIAARQSIAFMIAENAIEVDAARLLTWEAAWRMDRGEDAARAAFQAKAYAADMALLVCDRGVQILGGHGYIREHPVEMWLRNARGFSALEGTVMV